MAGVLRLELFDRAMAIAAQLFTSIFPVLIMVSVWLGASRSKQLADAVEMPTVTREVVDEAIAQSGGTAFGILGTIIVLLSATSLSRALTRAMATIWELPRPRARLTNAWRWVAVVLTLTLAAAAGPLGRYADVVPPVHAWPIVLQFCLDILLASFVPWLLLTGQVSMKSLGPGALTFALVMLAVRPANNVYLPRALEHSADRYGSIGVAFVYLASLYIFAWVFLAAQIVGYAVAGTGAHPSTTVAPDRPRADP